MLAKRRRRLAARDGQLCHSSNIWQRAADARDTARNRVSGSGLTWPRTDVARIVAIPLFVSREAVGTLIAGLRPGPVAQGCVERFELRGELAATALRMRQCIAALSLERKRQQAILQSDSAAKIIIGPSGQIGALSRGAQELLGEAGPDAGIAEEFGVSSRRVLSELFQAPDQPKVEAWLQCVQAAPHHDHGLDHESQDGSPSHRRPVRLHPISLSDTPGSVLAAVTLEVIGNRAVVAATTPQRNSNCTTLSNGSKKVSCSSTRITKFKR